MPDDELPSVSVVYKQIFEADPLLLELRHQATFGDQILRNLLVERAIAATEPAPVTLSSKRSRIDFKTLPKPPKRGPSENLKNRYAESRRLRDPMPDDAAEKLIPYTMVAKASYTLDRLGKTYDDDEVASETVKETKSPLPSRLKIAAIGYRVTVSRMPDGAMLDEELCPRFPANVPVKLVSNPEAKGVEKIRRTKLRPSADPRPWVDAVKRHVQRALEKGSTFVMLPEFALPPDTAKTKMATALTAIAKAFKHPFFLFSGSRHEGAYNRGFILTRDKKGKLSDAWWHYKLASARGLGENIMGPQTSRLPSYTFEFKYPGSNESLYYRVFVAICYDVFDPTTFINYIVQCAESDVTLNENIILVPSFNPAKEFVHALRDLSFIAGCPVIYVNGLHGDAKLFLYGIAISDLVDIEKKGEADQKSKFDEYFDRTRAELVKDIEKAMLDYKAAKFSSEAKRLDLGTKRRLKMVAADMQRQVELLKGRSATLDKFRLVLNDLRNKGALSHLITTERCSACEDEAHQHGEYCANDILYYNIDIALLRELKWFRDNYFISDNFLPSPFRRDEKAKISAAMQKKKEQREARATHKSQKKS